MKQRRETTSRPTKHVISFSFTTRRGERTEPKGPSVPAFVEVGQCGEYETSLDNALEEKIGYFENDSRNLMKEKSGSITAFNDDNFTATAADCKEKDDQEKQCIYFERKGHFS